MDLVLRAILFYGVLLVLLRITGKRALSQITTFDFVLLLVIGEATQQALAAIAKMMWAQVAFLGEEGEQVIRRPRPEHLARLERSLERGAAQVGEKHMEIVRVDPRLLR